MKLRNIAASIVVAAAGAGLVCAAVRYLQDSRCQQVNIIVRRTDGGDLTLGAIVLEDGREGILVCLPEAIVAHHPWFLAKINTGLQKGCHRALRAGNVAGRELEGVPADLLVTMSTEGSTPVLMLEQIAECLRLVIGDILIDQAVEATEAAKAAARH